MPQITTHYGIPDPVPFLDVEVTADNRFYVDPHVIRLLKTPQPFAEQALECVDTFFQEVTSSVIEGTSSARQRGQGLLQRFVEPWETRLGMAAEGFHGHGGAELVGTWIWQALNNDVEALVRVGVLRQLEDVPLFVEGVDRDITSDITTRLIFEPLARFTAAMIDLYPQFTNAGHEVDTYRRQVWDPIAREWSEADTALPTVGGKPLLLVPKGWARSTLLMSSGRYYETTVLSFAQLEQAVRGSDGKLLTTPKDRLKAQPGLGRGRLTNLSVTLRAFENEQDLLAGFKAFVASRFD
ncbi:hypothetical protein ACFXKD_00370 [Nocardiopsis aegyptia]|uniref:hypothetical protein n=1 Tax=Nocardiopsis aegyptia TaxID=220378 RepID=UPI00366B0B4D